MNKHDSIIIMTSYIQISLIYYHSCHSVVFDLFCQNLTFSYEEFLEIFQECIKANTRDKHNIYEHILFDSIFSNLKHC